MAESYEDLMIKDISCFLQFKMEFCYINGKKKNSAVSSVAYCVNKNKETETFTKLVGCSLLFFKNRIETLFHDGMTWENRGLNGWHLDHIVPASHFNMSIKSELEECFNYTNFQPMWSNHNKSKQDKLGVYVENIRDIDIVQKRERDYPERAVYRAWNTYRNS